MMTLNNFSDCTSYRQVDVLMNSATKAQSRNFTVLFLMHTRLHACNLVVAIAVGDDYG
jgi:hypothetical protein